MSPIRKLAVRILGAVVRWASPGCKEWAEGLAREVEFIGSDWSALGWAIGSFQVVLNRREASIGSGSKPARPSRLDVMFWLLYLEMCFWSGTRMLTATGWQQRLGWGLALLACGYWAACSVLNWLRDRWQPSTSDIEAYRRFLREGLELKLSRYRTVRRWFPSLANFSGWVGYLLIRGEVHFWGYFILGWLLILPLHLDTAANIQGRIERMDALIAEGQPVNLRLNGKRLHSDHWGRPHPETPTRL
jgi:hypothetical protein